MPQKNCSPLLHLPFWAFVPLLALTAWLSSPGIFLGDEYVYAEHTVSLSRGTFVNDGHHFANRFGLLLPGVLFVKLLGTHYAVFFLWPFLCFLLLLYSVRRILRKEDEQLAFTVFFLSAFNPALLRLAADVAVDLVMTTFMTFAVFFTYYIRRTEFGERTGGILVAFTLFYAVFTKMTAIYCFPFFGLLLLRDWRRRQFYAFWKSLLLSSLLLYLLYFGAYYYDTGDALFRFRGFEGTHGSGEVVPWNYRNRPWQDILARITVYPVAFFLFAPGYGMLMLSATFAIFVKKLWKKSGLACYATVYFLTIIAAFWFGSSSFRQYNPVILAERMLLPILPAAAVLTGLLWSGKQEILLGKNFVRAKDIICGLLILFCFALFAVRPDKGLGLSCSVFILLLFIFTQRKKIFFSPLLKMLFLLPFAVQILYRICVVVPEIPFFHERRFLQNAEKQRVKTLVLTDDRTAQMQAIFFDFQPTEYVTVSSVNQPAADLNYQHVVLHDNRERLQSIRFSNQENIGKVKQLISDTLLYRKNVHFYRLRQE